MKTKSGPRGRGIYQRGEVWYTDYLDAGTDKGGKLVRRRVRTPLPGMGKIEAENYVAELVGKTLQRIRAIKDGRADSTLTMREYIEAYFPWGKVKKGSREWYSEMKMFEKHIYPAFGDVQLSAIREGDIEDFRSGLPTLRPDTVNGIMSMLKRVLLRAERKGHIHAAPGFPPALEVETLELQFNEDEEARLIAAFDDADGFKRSMSRKVVRHGHKLDVVFPASREAAYQSFRRAKPLFVIALQTGLTRGDLLGLRWKQVTPDGVQGARKKTGKRYQAVFHNPTLAKIALAECRNASPVSKDFVFVTADGKPYTERSLARYYAKALSLAKIQPRELEDGTKRLPRFHDARHTFATRWLEKGATLDVIGRMLGHSPKTWAKTVARYAKSSDEAVLAQTRALLKAGRT